MLAANVMRSNTQQFLSRHFAPSGATPTRMTDDLETRRRRAVYRATHRGTKEMDWILGRYAMAQLAAMQPAQLAAFEELLALPDPVLQDMIFEPGVFPQGEFSQLIGKLRVFHGLLPAVDGEREGGTRR
jgi:antitoxin CptB